MHSLETMRRLNNEAEVRAESKRNADQRIDAHRNAATLRLSFAGPTRIYGPQE